jgi:hypothetical protein
MSLITETIYYRLADGQEQAIALPEVQNSIYSLKMDFALQADHSRIQTYTPSIVNFPSL